jgi:hypothetical protein
VPSIRVDPIPRSVAYRWQPGRYALGSREYDQNGIAIGGAVPQRLANPNIIARGRASVLLARSDLTEPTDPVPALSGGQADQTVVPSS